MAGERELSALKKMHGKLDCPYELQQLLQHVNGMVVGQFVEEEPGNWYRQPHLYKNMAPVTFDELLSREKSEEIQEWLLKFDTDITP
jgi:hypothetical protein